MASLNIVNYSDKSFVVTGDDTRKYKDHLKNLGGKWNSRLTNKANGEKFSGWVFYSSLREKVENWIKNPTSVIPESKNDNQRINELENRMAKLELIIENLTKSNKTIVASQYDLDELDDIYENEIPTKRLLK